LYVLELADENLANTRAAHANHVPNYPISAYEFAKGVLNGTFTDATNTPFYPFYNVTVGNNDDSLRNILNHQIKAKASGLVYCGSADG
jgi:hypothetical protein